jgi:hypothetical protein
MGAWDDDDEDDYVRVTLRDLDKYSELPLPKPWIIDSIIPEGLTLLYGAREAGKSFLAQEMAFAVAAGQPWLGKYETRRSDVVYIYAEDPDEHRIIVLTRKYADYLFATAEEPEDENGVEGPLDLMNHKVISGLKQSLKHDGISPRFFVIDTVAATMAGYDENGPKDMGQYVRNVNELRNHYHASMLLVHHPGRESNHERGHTNLGNAASAVMKLTRVHKRDPSRPEAEKRVLLKLENEKMRSAAPFGTIYLDRVEVPLVIPGTEAEVLAKTNMQRAKSGMKPLTELPPITTCVIEPAAATADQVVGDAVGKKKTTERDRKAFDSLLSIGAAGAEDAEWRSAAATRGVKGGTFDRAKQSLIRHGRVMSESGRFIPAVVPAAFAA